MLKEPNDGGSTGGTPSSTTPSTGRTSGTAGQLTPRRDLDLQPGELVRVKAYDEILATVDTRLSNRGLSFDAELVPFCGKVVRVAARVERFVDEKNGQMRRMKTPAVILEGVTCRALYCGRRMFCPRSIHLWWREIWLERVSVDTRPRAPLSIHAGARTTADKAASTVDGIAAAEQAPDSLSRHKSSARRRGVVVVSTAEQTRLASQ